MGGAGGARVFAFVLFSSSVFFSNFSAPRQRAEAGGGLLAFGGFCSSASAGLETNHFDAITGWFSQEKPAGNETPNVGPKHYK